MGLDSFGKVGLSCVRSVISDAHVAGNDGIKPYSVACGRQNSLQEGLLIICSANMRA